MGGRIGNDQKWSVRLLRCRTSDLMKSSDERERTRLLVVGGTGFIGRHVVDRAVDLGWDVCSLSLRPQGHVRPGVRGISGDIATERDLVSAVGDLQFEYVVNCAGYIDHAPYFTGGRKAINAHFDGVLNLIDTLDREKIRMFVNIGSSDEYGSGPAPQVESQREAPVSPY